MTIQKTRATPRRAPPEVWALVREAYTGRATAAECAERFGVKEGAIRMRARRHGWTKKAAWAAATERLEGPPAPPAVASSRSPVVIAESALNCATEALAHGKSAEAQAHVKAGLAVGEFAELVKLLRARAGRDVLRNLGGEEAA